MLDEGVSLPDAVDVLPLDNVLDQQHLLWLGHLGVQQAVILALGEVQLSWRVSRGLAFLVLLPVHVELLTVLENTHHEGQ